VLLKLVDSSRKHSTWLQKAFVNIIILAVIVVITIFSVFIIWKYAETSLQEFEQNSELAKILNNLYKMRVS
jgi:cell division protein FtsN